MSVLYIPFLYSYIFQLKKTEVVNINLFDIHTDKPLKDYPVYSMVKKSNKIMVQVLGEQVTEENIYHAVLHLINNSCMTGPVIIIEGCRCLYMGN